MERGAAIECGLKTLEGAYNADPTLVTWNSDSVDHSHSAVEVISSQRKPASSAGFFTGAN